MKMYDKTLSRLLVTRLRLERDTSWIHFTSMHTGWFRRKGQYFGRQ